MHVAILGLGLIGGSIGRALAGAGDDWMVRAWSPSGDGPRLAERDGILTAASAPEAALEGAELVVLAGPPLACLELIDGLDRPWRTALDRHAVVTDVASTKGRIVDRARQAGLRFVGGHPMAGIERSGYAASTDDLFVDRPWVVVPPEPADEEAVERVVRLVEACRARPIRLGATEHDAAVAAISHLPLVVAAALVETIAGPAADRPGAGWGLAAQLAAGGWQGMTRLARGEPVMGAGILATNGPAVSGRLRDLRTTIDDWIRVIEDPATTPETLEARLAAAKARLDEP